jgi:hypothetical protein
VPAVGWAEHEPLKLGDGQKRQTGWKYCPQLTFALFTVPQGQNSLDGPVDQVGLCLTEEKKKISLQ